MGPKYACQLSVASYTRVPFKRLPLYYGSVGSASAFQAVDSKCESRLRLTFLEKAENIPVLSGRLVLIYLCGDEKLFIESGF